MTVLVNLADGKETDLSILDADSLHRLQYEQEQLFARRIVGAPRGSPERATAIAQGYDTVCSILALRRTNQHEPLSMGLDRRYIQLVLGELRRQESLRRHPAKLFEIGYGSGQLLSAAAAAGYAASGIEVSQSMREQACRELPKGCHGELLVGQFLDHPKLQNPAQFQVVYWNDVFEHIPPDEIRDYLRQARRLLAPGGCLITITPNWHERPSDVTGDFCPARSEANGLHLKEYTLREVTALLQETGFERVVTPFLRLKRRIVLAGGCGSWAKRVLEPCLEWLPFNVAEKLARGFSLSSTLAYAPEAASA